MWFNLHCVSHTHPVRNVSNSNTIYLIISNSQRKLIKILPPDTSCIIWWSWYATFQSRREFKRHKYQQARQTYDLTKVVRTTCWNRLTRVKPVRAPLSSFRCRTPKSARRRGNSASPLWNSKLRFHWNLKIQQINKRAKNYTRTIHHSVV